MLNIHFAPIRSVSFKTFLPSYLTTLVEGWRHFVTISFEKVLPTFLSNPHKIGGIFHGFPAVEKNF